MSTDSIVGYMYEADLYCPEHIVEQLARRQWAADPVEAGRVIERCARDSAESALDALAHDLAIEREDETTFDSDDFPKVVLAGMLDGDEHCGKCGEEL